MAAPHFIGPTWATDENGDWVLPEHTLGWGILNWLTSMYLPLAGRMRASLSCPRWNRLVSSSGGMPSILTGGLSTALAR